MNEALNKQNNPYRIVMRQLRRTFIQVGLFSAAINILMLTGPIYMLQVYDRVLSSGSVATLAGSVYHRGGALHVSWHLRISARAAVVAGGLSA